MFVEFANVCTTNGDGSPKSLLTNKIQLKPALEFIFKIDNEKWLKLRSDAWGAFTK